MTGYLEKIGIFFRIGCALINKFCPPLSKDSPRHDRIAAKTLELVGKENLLEIRVDEEKMERYTKAWAKASAAVFQDFPQLSFEDLEDLTQGVYQIGLAKRYTRVHMSNTDDYKIMLNTDYPGIVRAKIESRFTSKTHNCWIEFDPEMAGAEAITAYYCRCRNGARTLGMCAHVCSVCIFYFINHKSFYPLF
jgi:hypothetical protein